jgi:hypothetical protein
MYIDEDGWKAFIEDPQGYVPLVLLGASFNPGWGPNFLTGRFADAGNEHDPCQY